MLNDVPLSKTASGEGVCVGEEARRENNGRASCNCNANEQQRGVASLARKPNKSYTFLEKMALRSFFFDLDVTKKQKILISVPSIDYLLVANLCHDFK